MKKLESMTDDELRSWGESLIFDPPPTPESDPFKFQYPCIEEMQKRNIDVEQWLRSLPTEKQWKEQQRSDEIDEIVNSVIAKLKEKGIKLFSEE